MSFLDDIVDFASGAFSWFTGSSTTASLARTAITGYALRQVTNSINKENDAVVTAERTPPVDPGVRLQVSPDPEHRIPVVYGTAYLGGIVTDAYLTDKTDVTPGISNGWMYYVVTLCELTGTKYSDDQQTTFTFNNIYWDDSRIVFNSDGITLNKLIDRDGNEDTELSGLIKIYCYAGSSSDPVVPTGYTNNGLTQAYNVMPGWTSSHVMSDLVFAIIRVEYNKDKGSTKLGNTIFQLTNSMTLAGDCLYDIMTSTRYGAGIPAAEIYQE
jgi:hypothetical protein